MTIQTLTWCENNGFKTHAVKHEPATTWADTRIGFTTSLYAPWRLRTG